MSLFAEPQAVAVFSNSSNVTPGNDVSNGYCTNNNLYFVIQAAAACVLVGLIAVLNLYFSRRPKLESLPQKTAQWKVTYGLPRVGIFLYTIAFWCVTPAVVLFFIFHVVIPDGAISMAHQMACLSVMNIPFFTLFLVFQTTLLLAFYNPIPMAETLKPIFTALPKPVAHSTNASLLEGSELQSPNNGISGPRRRVLMVGVPSRGIHFAYAMQHEADQNSGRESDEGEVEYFVFDVSCVSEAYIVQNCVAYSKGVWTPAEVQKRILSPPVTVDSSSSILERLAIPAETESFDKVVFCPFIRSSSPIGDYVTSDKLKTERMHVLLSEAIRVLRVGGELLCVDGAMDTVLTSSDLRDATGHGGVVSDTGAQIGFIPLMKMKVLQVRWEKSSAVSVVGEGQLLLNEDVCSPRESYGVIMDDSELMKEAKQHPVPQTVRQAVVIPYQATTFLVLLFVAAGLYAPTNTPQNVVLSQRVNSIFPSLATNYPIVAFFARAALYDMDHIVNVRQLIVHLVPTDILALIASLLFTALFWVPQFVLQVALDSSSLSDNAKTYIGIGISVALGYAMYIYGRKRSAKKLADNRGFTEEQRRLVFG